jgi:hypothetical protein
MDRAQHIASPRMRENVLRYATPLPPGIAISASMTSEQRLSWNAEGTALLTTVVRDQNTDLWILDGLKAPSAGWRRWFWR